MSKKPVFSTCELLFISEFIEHLPNPISCSRNETPRQMLSELELFAAVIKLGSAVKCGTMKIIDPSPIMTAPEMNNNNNE